MFDDRLKELRIKKGLNMKQLAEALNIPYTTYVGYEKNEREPNSESLIDIATFFNVSTDYLLGRKKNVEIEKSTTVNTRFEINSSEQQMIRKYRTLDDYGKEAVENILDVEHRRCTDVQYAYRVARSFNDKSKPKVVEVDELKYINAPDNDIDM